MQKYFDQAISGNWSYNPEHYENGEVLISVMAQDLLNTYKYGWKTSYYQNTYDSKKDEDEPSHPVGWVMCQKKIKKEDEDEKTVIRVQYNELCSKYIIYKMLC